MNRELHSWKEIAGYFGVTARTAQKWEQHQGLPVHRLPGTKGRVLALTDELDAWKLSGKNSNGNLPAPQPVPPSVPAHRNLYRLALLAATALIFGAILAYWRWSRPGEPSRWRIEDNTLIITDARNREVWRWSADYPVRSNLTPEFNEQRSAFIEIGDVDGDGANETLFVPHPRDWGKTQISTPLICFDRAGRERWRFVPGRSVSSGRETFPNSYSPRNFVIAPMGTGRPKLILVSSIHMPDYPCQIALLDPRSGKVIREYWHSGYIGDSVFSMQLADLDGDGVSEIYLGGVNQARLAATLVVLHPDHFEGASWEENKDYALKGMPPGREIRRVIFPHTCLNEKAIPGSAEAIFMGPGDILVRVQDGYGYSLGLHYYFSPAGLLQKISPIDSFLQAHEAALKAGTIDHPFTRDELRSLEKRVIILPPSYELASAKK